MVGIIDTVNLLGCVGLVSIVVGPPPVFEGAQRNFALKVGVKDQKKKVFIANPSRAQGLLLSFGAEFSPWVPSFAKGSHWSSGVELVWFLPSSSGFKSKKKRSPPQKSYAFT